MISSYSVQTLPNIEGIARRCFRDFGYPGEFSWPTFRKTWEPIISSGVGSILRAYRQTDPTRDPNLWAEVGILGFVVAPDQFNGQSICLGNFWYVVPEARRSGSGRELLKAAEAIARDRGCYRMLMGHPRGHDKFFQSEGFEPIETGYQKVF